MAWGRVGHREVCLQAWEEMREPTRAAVVDLLDIQTADQFADSCYWADEVRPDRPNTGPWHYIYIPKHARAIDLDRDCPLPASCIIREIDRHAEILESDAPKLEQAEALKFLAHFVGDLHQPLHVGFAEDRGGSDIEITFLSKKTNMLALWDWGLFETPAPVDMTPNLTRALRRLNRDRWIEKTALEWAEESMWIMRTPATGYVGNPGGQSFGATYVKQNHPVAKEQIERAGGRLGHKLNQIFDQ